MISRANTNTTGHPQKQNIGTWNISNKKIGEKTKRNPYYKTGNTPTGKEQRNNKRNNEGNNEGNNEINNSNFKPGLLFYKSKNNFKKNVEKNVEEKSQSTSRNILQNNSHITSQSTSQSTPQRIPQNISHITPQQNKSIKNQQFSPSTPENIRKQPQTNIKLLSSPIKKNIENPTLRDLIFNLIKGPGSSLINGEQTFTELKNVNKLLNNYEKPKANIQQILSTPFKLTLQELNQSKKTIKGRGAHSTIYSLNNKGVVYKEFRNPGIKTLLLPELYGGLINAKIQQSLSPENQRYINKILQMYAHTYRNEKGPQNTLIVYLEESEGDLITFTEKYPNLDINQASDFLDTLSGAIMKMAKILKEEGLVHRDIKPDNILYKIKNGEIILELADFSTCINENTIVYSNVGTDSYFGNKFVKEFYTSGKRAIIDSSSDLLAMGLTLFNIYIVILYKKGIKLFNNHTGKYDEINQYFPFTNDKSTIRSKIENWSDRGKYDYQVFLLKTFLRNSLQDILGRPGLTEHSKNILKRDVQMIETLLLSNDPFVDRIDSTYEEIERYLAIV
jgi:serine/threonine protein kinase